MPTITERLAALEAERPFIKEQLTTIGTDVKELVAAKNKQRGYAKVGHLLLNVSVAAASVGATLKWWPK